MALSIVQVNHPVVLNITNITTVANLARVDFGAAHPILVGDMLRLVNVNQPSNLNGVFEVIAVGANTADLNVKPNAAYVAPATATDDKAILDLVCPERKPRDGSAMDLEEYIDGDAHGLYQRTIAGITSVAANRVVVYFGPGLYVMRLPPNATSGVEIYARIEKALTDTFNPLVDYTIAPHDAKTNPAEVLIGSELRRRLTFRQGDAFLQAVRLRFSSYTKVGLLASAGTESMFVEFAR